ncbi:TPA: phosphohydrolase [bacterium]|nr:phosphohydrolase [bacterium]
MKKSRPDFKSKYFELKEQLNKLNRIGMSLSSEHNLDTLLEMILCEARHFTQADAGSLYLKEGNRLKFVIAQNDTLSRKGHKEPFRSFYVKISKESIAGYVAATGRPLNIKDAHRIPESKDYRFDQSFDKKMGYRTRSILAIPMKNHENEIIGVLQLINALDQRGKTIAFTGENKELVSSLASQAAVAIQNTKLIYQIKSLFRSLVEYSASAIDARSPHTAGHSRRVCQYALRMAQAINVQEKGPFARTHFNEEELEELEFSAWLHDIGKIGVREWVLEKSDKLSKGWMEAVNNRFDSLKKGIANQALTRKNELLLDGVHDEEQFNQLNAQAEQITRELDEELDFIKRVNTSGFMGDEDIERLDELLKRGYISLFEYENLSVRKGNLTEEERKEIQSHINYGVGILSKIPFPRNLAHIPFYAGCHHEMLNGEGYPKGLKEGDIPLQARILAVADIFDALTAADRPYKKAVPIDKALNILQKEAEIGHLDPEIIKLFIEERLYGGVK